MEKTGVVERVRIVGFRSLRDVKLELKSGVTVLVGANGAGKSNVLSALELAGQLQSGGVQNSLLRWGGFAEQLYRGNSAHDDAECFSIELWEKERNGANGRVANGYKVTFTPGPDDSALLQEQFLYWDKRYPGHLDPGSGMLRRESRLAESDPRSEELNAEGQIRAYVRPLIEGLKSYHFDDTSLNAPPLTWSDLADDGELNAEASNVAAVLYRLKEWEPEVYDAIVRSVRGVAPFFDDFVLQPRGERIQLRWKHVGQGQTLSGGRLSSGTLRFICLSVLLHQPNLPRTIVLDEPELGLHPVAIYHLVELLRGAAEGRRIIVSTQSVTMLNQFSCEEVCIATRREGATELIRPDEERLAVWLEDYAMGELWEKNILQGAYPQLREGA